LVAPKQSKNVIIETKPKEKVCTSRVAYLRSHLLSSLVSYKSQQHPLFFLKTGPPGAGAFPKELVVLMEQY